MRNSILLVDDDQDHCELLRAMLVRLGYGVTATTSGEEALDHAGRERFSVVITDLSMSPMSGFELCEKLVGSRERSANHRCHRTRQHGLRGQRAARRSL